MVLFARAAPTLPATDAPAAPATVSAAPPTAALMVALSVALRATALVLLGTVLPPVIPASTVWYTLFCEPAPAPAKATAPPPAPAADAEPATVSALMVSLLDCAVRLTPSVPETVESSMNALTGSALFVPPIMLVATEAPTARLMPAPTPKPTPRATAPAVELIVALSEAIRVTVPELVTLLEIVLPPTWSDLIDASTLS
jgi:hypothetical protein